MLQKTKAIVLNSIKYKENSLIAYCYSEEFGRLSILVNGAFAKGKQPGKSIFFQPFNVLNIVFYQSPKTSLHKLKEVEFVLYQQTIPFDPIKRSIALFLSEFIYRTVKEEEANATLYNFIENFISELDTNSTGAANLHLIFLAQFTKLIGFQPINYWTKQNSFFDYKNGAFVEVEPRHTLYFNRELSQLLGSVLTTPFQQAHQICMSHTQRSQIIDGLICYVKYHLNAAFEINSLPVLSTVFQ